mgnify:FL=1
MIKTAIILCAGYGKRLNPITLKIPKPLIKLKNKPLLTSAIDLVLGVGIKKIIINTFYLPDQITDFVRNSQYKNIVEVINDGKEILDTGGGIKNLIKKNNEKNFFILNPDTLWTPNYKKTIIQMTNYFEQNNLSNLLMVVKKKKCFDKRFKGDFIMKDNKLSKNNNNQFVFTGFQIINRKILEKVKEKKFSMNKVWNDQMINSCLNGYESKRQFIHLTDIKIYKKLLKNN